MAETPVPVQSQAPQSVNFTLKLIIGLAALAVVLVIAVVLVRVTKHKTSYNPVAHAKNHTAYGPAPEGLLVLSVARKTATGEQLEPMVYDLSTKKLSYVPVDQLAGAPAGSNLAMQHAFSSNGNYVAFVGALNVKSADVPYIPTQIYRADLSEAKSNQDFVVKLQQAKTLTSGSGIVRLSPTVSNNGDVAYFAHIDADQGTLTSALANNWSIHLISAGSDQLVTAGIYPKWVSDTQFIFIKNDGLHLYDTASKSDKKIWGSRGATDIGMSLAVSNDSQYIAWTAPEANGVYIFQAADWSSGTLELKGSLHLASNGVAFSPDSRTLIVQSPLSTPSASGGIVESFFDVITFKVVATPYVIRNVDQELAFLTDWLP